MLRTAEHGSEPFRPHGGWLFLKDLHPVRIKRPATSGKITGMSNWQPIIVDDACDYKPLEAEGLALEFESVRAGPPMLDLQVER